MCDMHQLFVRRCNSKCIKVNPHLEASPAHLMYRDVIGSEEKNLKNGNGVYMGPPQSQIEDFGTWLPCHLEQMCSQSAMGDSFYIFFMVKLYFYTI